VVNEGMKGNNGGTTDIAYVWRLHHTNRLDGDEQDETNVGCHAARSGVFATVPAARPIGDGTCGDFCNARCD